MSGAGAAAGPPLCLVTGPGADGAVTEILRGLELEVFDSAQHFLDGPGRNDAGQVLLGPDLDGAEVRRLLGALAERTGPWMPILLERAGEGAEDAPGEMVAYPLSLGYGESLETLRGKLERPGAAAGGADAPPPILELRAVVREIGRTRHDINNPLTAALAETQLLLLDLEEGEARESLETVERQLRRIRDLVAGLSSVRPPTPLPRDEAGAG